ncbi:SDR family oxidoreductase [Methanocella arvoryzae]|uniref:dTDP-4-dehydrorhamnose reductase n=1 Tax=Methanocella arvoryzae (strain DSM 22066 / NBRC 105507 / MRE50) TaxID=351160 RepID=Q0W055_METAR|nr:sugar nucleotide-binding protein [Methanocella arvoryzae]CAJ38238.1 dTDP-4-dehydrorhamnose reductase [Methanocella arvoryzae MRE50]
MILVTGCGPLGAGLVKAMEDQPAKGACDESNPDIPRGFMTYNFEKEQDIRRIVDVEKPKILVLTEEIDNVEYCEENRMDAMYYNTRAQRYFAEAAQNVGARLVLRSSAMVFDGRKPGGMYTEEDHTNPLNVYAETKVMAETAVDRTKDFLVVRLGELYGAYFDNFASHLVESLSMGQNVELATDMYFSPIYLDDAIAAIKELTLNGMTGFYHVAGPERLSHYEFGKKIARAFGFSEDRLVPITMADLKLTVLVPRDTSLSSAKLNALMKVRGVDEGLAAMKTAAAAGKN